MDPNVSTGLVDVPHVVPNATVACNGSTLWRLTEVDEMRLLLNTQKWLAG